MFDFIKRMIWGELDKDKVKKYVLTEIEKENQRKEFLEKCKHTPSFSRCVIDNGTYKRIKHEEKKLEKSQKQKQQLKSYNLRSYKDAVVGTSL